MLTKISLFWFEKLKDIIPTHFVTANIDEMPEEVRQYRSQLEGRVMLVKKAQVVPLEAIVRGYLTGRTLDKCAACPRPHCVVQVPDGPSIRSLGPFTASLFRLVSLRRRSYPNPCLHPPQKPNKDSTTRIFPQNEVGFFSHPLFRVDITPRQAASIVGQDTYDKISASAIQLYKAAAEYALTRGLILADTKFEFGLVPSLSGGEELILVDELLTPDSSRYWPAEGYKPGGPQPSFDKQYLRDWLTRVGFRKGFESGPEGKEGKGWEMEPDVIEGTRERYLEALKLLLGNEVTV